MTLTELGDDVEAVILLALDAPRRSMASLPMR